MQEQPSCLCSRRILLEKTWTVTMPRRWTSALKMEVLRLWMRKPARVVRHCPWLMLELALVTLFNGLGGTPTTECAYVKSNVTDLAYFSSKVTFGTGGVEKVHDLGQLNELEKERLEEVKAQLKSEIDTGLKFAEGLSV